MSDFKTVWDRHHLGYFPVAYMMREAEAPRWVRFHSLPESKRYAETQAERELIIERQNTLADAVFGDDPCWLVQVGWDVKPGYQDITPPDYYRVQRDYGLLFAFRFVVDEGDGEELVGNAHAGLLKWTSGAFDPLLLKIADDERAGALWMSDRTGAVFAPYDGGVDLFLPNGSRVQDLRARYSDWLSPYEHGL